LIDVLNDIRAIDWPTDDVFGETTCNIGVISGGTRANVIPDAAHATIQIRLAAGSATVKELLEIAIAQRTSIEYKSVHDPLRLMALDGFEQMIARFTTDIPYLSNWGRPLLIGPGSILDAHTDAEKISKNELVNAVDLYAGLAKKLLSK
jgi:acetylornithine deacetylase